MAWPLSPPRPFRFRVNRLALGMEKLLNRECELCGKPIKVRPRVLKRGWGRTCKHCAQILRVLGRKNPNFRHGKRRAYWKERISPERRAAIRKRDGYRCVNCGQPGRELGGKKLDVHHVISVLDGGPDTDDNLVTVCRRCHGQVEMGRMKLRWHPHMGGTSPFVIHISSASPGNGKS